MRILEVGTEDDAILSEIATALNFVFKGEIDSLGITSIQVVQDVDRLTVAISLSRPGLLIGLQGSTIHELTRLISVYVKQPVLIDVRGEIPWWKKLSCYGYDYIYNEED